MIIFYHILDVMSTILEASFFYIVAFCFHLIPENKTHKKLPYILWIFIVYIFTWFYDLGIYKSVIFTLCMLLFWVTIYQVSFFRAAILSMFSMIFILFSESFGSIVSAPFVPREGVIIANQMVIHWSIYLIIFISRIGILIFIYCVFKDFCVLFTWKDFLVVLINFIIVQAIYIFYYIDFFSGDTEYFNVILETLCLLFSIGCLIPFFYFKNYFILQEKEKENQLLIEQMQIQCNYYKEKQKEEEQVRSVYHDLKNHLLILKSQTYNAQEIQQAIENLQKQIAGFENYYHTGNEFLDVIIHDKSRQAQEKQIDFSVNIHFEDCDFIELLDISTIFGNALDNAIEASEKLSKDERLISVKVSRVRDMLIIVIENNAILDLTLTDKSTKKNTFLHGFGLPNIKKAVAKYDGQCIARLEHEKFTLKIIIPIP